MEVQTQGQQIDAQAARIKALENTIKEQEDQLDAADRKVSTLTTQLERCTKNSHLWEQTAKSAEYTIGVLKELIKETRQ